MNKLLLIAILFISANCSGQMMPSAHRNDNNTNNNAGEDALKRQQQLDKEKALLENLKKYKAPDLVQKPKMKKIKVKANTMNIYNPFTESIALIIVYSDKTKEDLLVAPDDIAKLSKNDTCQSIIVCGDKSNYNICKLNKGSNYDIRANGTCLTLVPSNMFVK